MPMVSLVDEATLHWEGALFAWRRWKVQSLPANWDGEMGIPPDIG